MTYPDISDKNFNKKLVKKFSKYEITGRKKSFNQICYPKEYNLQIPQLFVSQYINPKTPYKDILIYHGIGSGKTCSSITIAEQWKHKKHIIVVLPASLINNYRDELISQCAGEEYVTKEERKLLKTLNLKSLDYKTLKQNINERINKYYSIYSYNKFVELVQLKKIKDTNKSLLIIDEVQNIISEKGVYYKTIYNFIHNSSKNLRVVLLSATPIPDKPQQIAQIMNLLRLPLLLPTGDNFVNNFIQTEKAKYNVMIQKAKNLDTFKDLVRGFISYYHGAPDYVFPEAIIKYVKCEMSDFQYNAYSTVLLKEKSRFTSQELSINDLPTNFLIGPRIISNIVYPNKKLNEAGFKSFTKNVILDEERLKIYSIKFYMIMKKIDKGSGKMFVYSNFKRYGGLQTLIKILDVYGYKDYAKEGTGKKRYAIFSGDQTIEYKNEIKTVYNNTDNLNGNKIKLILLSSAAKEGISLHAVRQGHILEPYWNISRLKQIIGRAVRYCSHKDLSEEKRIVRIYIYVASHPNEKESVDQYIVNLAKYKQNIISQFEMALKEGAIDCKLFKKTNETKEEKIECD